MIPGEIFPAEGTITLNEGRNETTLMVANTGDRPVQVGSHFHFAETKPALDFDRSLAHGQRLNLPAGTATRFEPGQQREVRLVPFGGQRIVYGFNQKRWELYNAPPHPPPRLRCQPRSHGGYRDPHL